MAISTLSLYIGLNKACSLLASNITPIQIFIWWIIIISLKHCILVFILYSFCSYAMILNCLVTIWIVLTTTYKHVIESELFDWFLLGAYNHVIHCPVIDHTAILHLATCKMIWTRYGFKASQFQMKVSVSSFKRSYFVTISLSFVLGY